ncbi:hypothetical protein P171DRAFT_436715 [Karstenula rhodostoma CBS 690.94]|uniref:F-box domain-containing protein n=1 Tax=Karstenula rhodostoma CBS 690.94 TaxID=1392251 RepID=A0A9P4U743_9PLEO|nr:hypothetical protein P171DRAFT_436715 [Karstenula rhodostoma CBS 690.94]
MCYCVTLELTPPMVVETCAADATLGPAITPPLSRNSVSATSLARLPAEVLVQIARSLDDHKSLAHLGRANRRLNNLLTPLIYTKFFTSFGKETLFLRTLTSQSHLASHVKHLRWIDESDIWDQDKEGYETETRKEIAASLSTLPSLFHKQLAIAVQHATAGTLHVSLLAAAMSLTPFLETLTATLTTANSSRIRWNEAIWIAAPHAFAHLHTIRIKLRRSAGMDLNPLFLLPAVRTLDLTHVDRLKSDPQKTIWLPLPAGCSGVTTLLLRESNVDTDILVPAIRACRRLTTFLFQQHNKWSPLRKLDMALLSSALRVHAESLRDVGVMERVGQEESAGGVQELLGMPALERVLLPLCDGEVKGGTVLKLPPRARYFAQTVRGDGMRKAVEGFMALCSRSVKAVKEGNPLLRGVTLWVVDKEARGSLVAYMARQAWKKEGLQLDIRVLEKKSDVGSAVVEWERYVGET